MSVMGWVYMALAAAGLPMGDPVWEKAQVLLRKWQGHTGGYTYTGPGYGSSGGTYNLAPAGVLGLMLSGLNTTDINVAAGLGWLFTHDTWYTAEDYEHVSKGMVKYGDRWVTPEDKAKLERGLVQDASGRWIDPKAPTPQKASRPQPGSWYLP